VPDQDHGGVLMKAYQSMLMQAEPATGTELDGKIYLLPAWPADWDVTFKLHAPRQTVVQGEYRGGRMIKLDVQPAARRKDVVLPIGVR
jgi:alpha-L-fucosidase 2